MSAAPRQRKSDRTRARILEAAVETFRVAGVAETRLADIAAAAELQTASLYYHFESKNALIEAVLASDLDAIYDLVQERVGALAPDAHAERLRAAIDAHLE